MIDDSEIPTQILETPETLNQENLYSQEIDSEAPTQIEHLNHEMEERALSVNKEGDGKFVDSY